jgi:hypothetical protein
MVTVAIGALELEYLVKILDWSRGPSRYIFSRIRLHLKIPSDSDSTALGITSLFTIYKKISWANAVKRVVKSAKKLSVDCYETVHGEH